MNSHDMIADVENIMHVRQLVSNELDIDSTKVTVKVWQDGDLLVGIPESMSEYSEKLRDFLESTFTYDDIGVTVDHDMTIRDDETDLYRTFRLYR